MRGGWQRQMRHGGELSVRLLGARREQTVRSQVTSVEGGFIEGATDLVDRFRIEEDDLWAGAEYSRPIGLGWRP